MRLFGKRPQQRDDKAILEHHEQEHAEDEAMKLVHETWRQRIEKRIDHIEAEIVYIKRDAADRERNLTTGPTGKGAE